MELTNEQIAEAFSRHDFEASYPYLAEDVRWNIVGESLVEGKENVISVCRESAAYLTGVTTDFGKFRSVITTIALLSTVLLNIQTRKRKGNYSAPSVLAQPRAP